MLSIPNLPPGASAVPRTAHHHTTPLFSDASGQSPSSSNTTEDDDTVSVTMAGRLLFIGEATHFQDEKTTHGLSQRIPFLQSRRKRLLSKQKIVVRLLVSQRQLEVLLQLNSMRTTMSYELFILCWLPSQFPLDVHHDPWAQAPLVFLLTRTAQFHTNDKLCVVIISIDRRHGLALQRSHDSVDL